MTDVRCKVQSCHYWGNNDVCKADSITVEPKNTTSGGRSGSMDFEIGDLDANTGRKGSSNPRSGSDISGNSREKTKSGHANTSQDTLCSTFKPKGNESRY